jgi:hypothetical protein
LTPGRRSSPLSTLPIDDDLLPKKRTAPPKAPASKTARAASPQMARAMKATRVVGLLLGGFVTLVGFMGLVGLVTDNFWVRLLVALVVVVGLPAFAAERVLRRSGGGFALVGDVFAILLLGVALMLVSADILTKGMLVDEGDRYATSGSRTMARVVYFLAGVAPTFPDEEGCKAPPNPAADGLDGGVDAGVDAEAR